MRMKDWGSENNMGSERLLLSGAKEYRIAHPYETVGGDRLTDSLHS